MHPWRLFDGFQPTRADSGLNCRDKLSGLAIFLIELGGKVSTWYNCPGKYEYALVYPDIRPNIGRWVAVPQPCDSTSDRDPNQ